MAGDITEVHDHGSVWRLVYRDQVGHERLVHFEHRPFSYFYEGATGRSFFEDYRFGLGADRIAAELVGRRVSVEGPDCAPVVRLED